MSLRFPLAAALGCSLSLLACNGDKEGVTGPQALEFAGQGSCATGEVAGAGFASEGTVEGWVQSTPDPLYRFNALFAWPGAFSLYQDPDGVIYFTDGLEGANGPSGFGDWMDGQLHHVAAQWFEDGDSALYLDGERLGTNTLATFGTEPDTTLHVGCWPGEEMVHEGVIDELRVSSVARYDEEGFDVPLGPFSMDDDTLVLWHFDEGEGDVATDDAVGVRLNLKQVEWVPFSLANTN